MDQNSSENQVEFEEEDQMIETSQAHHFDKKGMIGFVIKHSGGHIKSEKQANVVLVIVIVVVLVLTYMVIS